MNNTNASLNENFTSHEYIYTATEKTALRLSYGFFGSVGLTENIAVIAVIFCKEILRDIPSTWFVLSLAIADAVICLADIFKALIIGYDSIHIIFAILAQFAALSSTGNLLLLTLNRFLSVYNSLRYPAYMTTSIAKRLALVPWSNAFVITVVYGYSNTAGMKNMAYLVSVYYTVLILLIISLNVYLLKQARDKRKDDIRMQNAVSKNLQLFKRQYRIAIRLLIVNLTFFGSCVPVIITLYLYPTTEAREKATFYRRAMIWFYFITILNATIDPIVYSINHPIFTRYFYKFKTLFLRNAVDPI